MVYSWFSPGPVLVSVAGAQLWSRPGPSVGAQSPLLGAGAGGQSQCGAELLHRAPDRSQFPHRPQGLPGSGERVERAQPVRQHAGLSQRVSGTTLILQ